MTLLSRTPAALALAASALALPLVLAAPTPAAAAAAEQQAGDDYRQYGPWFSSRLGGGGFWLDTRPSVVDDRWYLWSDVGGMYRSDDDAATWHALHQNLPDDQGDTANTRGMVEHPDDPDKLVLLTGTRWRDVGGAWLTTDGGQTWKKTLEQLFWGNAWGREFGRTLVAAPDDPDVLVAAGQDGVYRSVNFGESWTKSNGAEGLNPTGLGFDPQDPSRWWLASTAVNSWTQGREANTPDAFYESTDGGRSWTQVSDEAPREIVQDPTDPSRWIGLFDAAVKESSDHGHTWSGLSAGLPDHANGKPQHIAPNQSYAIHAAGDAVVMVANDGQLYRLPGGGSSWQKVERKNVTAPDWWYGNLGQKEEDWIHYGKAAASITPDPTNPQRMLMTDWYATWETLDGGSTWAFSGDGAENTVLHGVVVNPAEPDRLMVFMGDNGLLNSDDRGHTLAQVHMPGAPLNSNVKQVVFAPSDPEVVWAIGNTASGQWESSTIARSRDAGRTWSYTQTKGLPRGLAKYNFINSLAVATDDADHAWVGLSSPVNAGGGIYETRDGGKSWTAINEGLPESAEIFTGNIWDAGPELAVNKAGDLLAISKSNNTLYHRPAGAKAWEKVGSTDGRPESIAADPHYPGRWFLASQGGGLAMSENPSGSWKTVLDRPILSFSFDAERPDHLVAGALDGVHETRDGGKSWTHLGGHPHRYFPTVAVGNGLVVAGTKGNGSFVAETAEAR